MTHEGIYRERLRAARAAMDERGIDYLLISPSSDLVYLLGYPAHTSERLTALVVPRTASPFIVAPTLEVPRLAERGELVEIVAWDETTDPIGLLARRLGTDTTVAVSEQLWSGFLLRLIAALPSARFVDAALVLRELRVVKAPEELAALREAGRRTDAVWEAFVAATTLTGKTEREVGREIATLMERHELGEPAFLICASGPASASPHHLTGERRIQAGDAVVFDFGGNVDGYKSDITRTVHVGEPDEEFQRVYALVDRARAAAFAAVRPGVPCANIDQAARAVIAEAGYGEYFIHRVGHGLGLDVHEEPYLVEGNQEALRPGMVFSDEPGVYLPGRFGVRIEDSVACTSDGGELLNNARRDLVVMR